MDRHFFVISGEQFQCAFQMAQLFEEAGLVASQEHLHPFIVPPQLFRSAPFGTHGLKLLFLAFNRSDLLDFRPMHLQKFPAIRQISESRVQGFLAFGGFLQAFDQCMTCFQQLGLIHPVVDQFGLKARLEEFLLSVLARMDEQSGPQFLDGFLRGQRIVDEQATAPRLRDQFPTNDEFLAGTHKERLDLRALPARTDHVRTEPLAHQKVERFQNEAFARPRFAGENVHPRREFQFHVCDQGQITNMQIFKHDKNDSYREKVMTPRRPIFLRLLANRATP